MVSSFLNSSSYMILNQGVQHAQLVVYTVFERDFVRREGIDEHCLFCVNQSFLSLAESGPTPCRSFIISPGLEQDVYLV